MRLPRRIAKRIIRVYQMWSKNRPQVCRFIPTCSVYADEAIHTHGFLKGCYLATKRLLKCHPLGSWGYDPLPEKLPKEVSEKVSSS